MARGTQPSPYHNTVKWKFLLPGPRPFLVSFWLVLSSQPQPPPAAHNKQVWLLDHQNPISESADNCPQLNCPGGPDFFQSCSQRASSPEGIPTSHKRRWLNSARQAAKRWLKTTKRRGQSGKETQRLKKYKILRSPTHNLEAGKLSSIHRLRLRSRLPPILPKITIHAHPLPRISPFFYRRLLYSKKGQTSRRPSTF